MDWHFGIAPLCLDCIKMGADRVGRGAVTGRSQIFAATETGIFQ